MKTCRTAEAVVRLGTLAKTWGARVETVRLMGGGALYEDSAQTRGGLCMFDCTHHKHVIASGFLLLNLNTSPRPLIAVVKIDTPPSIEGIAGISCDGYKAGGGGVL